MKTLISAFTALTLLTGGAQALDLSAMTDEEQQAFRDQVRSYLLENPEVIVEAISVLEAREAEEQQQADRDIVASFAEALFEDETAWVGGNPEGSFTIVEFLDYRCSFCRRAHPEVEALLEGDGDIRLIVKEFPILGPESETASRFALATRKVEGDEAYKAVHDALITLNAQVSTPILRRLGDQLELDTDEVIAAMDGEDITAIINANRALAQQLNISGTPSFVFEDTLVRGYLPLRNMMQVVTEARDRQG